MRIRQALGIARDFAGGFLAVFLLGAAVSGVQSAGQQEESAAPTRGTFAYIDDGECVQGADAKQSFMICRDGIATTRLESGYAGLEHDMEITVDTRTNSVTLREFNERGVLVHAEVNTGRAQRERVFLQSALTQNYALIADAINPEITTIADRALGFSPIPLMSPLVA